MTHGEWPRALPDDEMWQLAQAVLGRSVSDASAEVASRGLVSRVLPVGAPIPLDYLPARVTLWREGDHVVEATAAGRVFSSRPR